MTMLHETHTSELYFSARRLCSVVERLSLLPLGTLGLRLGPPAQTAKLTDAWLAEALEILHAVKEAREGQQPQAGAGDDLTSRNRAEGRSARAAATVVRMREWRT